MLGESALSCAGAGRRALSCAGAGRRALSCAAATARARLRRRRGGGQPNRHMYWADVPCMMVWHDSNQAVCSGGRGFAGARRRRPGVGGGAPRWDALASPDLDFTTHRLPEPGPSAFNSMTCLGREKASTGERCNLLARWCCTAGRRPEPSSGWASAGMLLDAKEGGATRVRASRALGRSGVLSRMQAVEIACRDVQRAALGSAHICGICCHAQHERENFLCEAAAALQTDRTPVHVVIIHMHALAARQAQW